MFPILYQDHHLVVIDKPAGLPVSPAPGAVTSVAAQTGLLVIHRLDTDTSGVLALGRDPETVRRLNAAFADRQVEKRYLAICVGEPREAAGEVDLPIGEWRRGRVSTGRGKAARTRWNVVAAQGGRVMVEAEPLTGRTHQIRAHLAAVGLPILGDDAYGGPVSTRVWLHALRLVLPWPGPKDRLDLRAPLPPGFELG